MHICIRTEVEYKKEPLSVMEKKEQIGYNNVSEVDVLNKIETGILMKSWQASTYPRVENSGKVYHGAFLNRIHHHPKYTVV